MDSNNKPLILFEKVSIKNDSSQLIFQDISLKIFKEEKIFILGHKDKERTLILYTILGINKALSGNIFLMGHEISKLNDRKLLNLRKNIGYVYPQNGLLKNISIEDNIALPLHFNSKLSDQEIKKTLEYTLDFFELNSIAKEKAWNLDNIIEKKVLLARAVINKPKLLLLDEPTTYIEEKDTKEIKKLIDKIIKADFLHPTATIITTSEDKKWAKKNATKILFLDKGKIKYWGKTKDFFE